MTNEEPQSQVVLRVPMRKKSSYVRAAKASEKRGESGKLTDWCVRVLDAAAEKEAHGLNPQNAAHCSGVTKPL